MSIQLHINAELGEILSRELEGVCEFGAQQGDPPRNSGRLEFNDAATWIQILSLVKEGAPIVASILLFWLGKGHIIEIQVGDQRITAKGFSVTAVTKLLNELRSK